MSEIERIGGVTVVRVTREDALHGESAFHDRLVAAIDRPTYVVFDMQQVEYCSTDFLSLLIRVQRHLVDLFPDGAVEMAGGLGGRTMWMFPNVDVALSKMSEGPGVPVALCRVQPVVEEHLTFTDSPFRRWPESDARG